MSEMIPLIHPSSVFKILWDLISMLLIAAFLIFIPLYVTFYDMLDVSLKQFMIMLAPIYVSLDVLINLNSSYYEKGLLIRKRSSIILNYWKRYSAAEFVIFTVCIVRLILMTILRFLIAFPIYESNSLTFYINNRFTTWESTKNNRMNGHDRFCWCLSWKSSDTVRFFVSLRSSLFLEDLDR